MFESLTEKLNGVFNRLGNQGRLTERDVDSALREIRMALLEADVNFRVARSFVGKIRERALSEDVLQSLSPGQQVVKITNEEMTAILDGGENKVVPGPSAPSVILMIGLNGSGKTTTSAKLARHLKQTGQLPVLVAADLNRPAAIDQLQTLGRQIDVEVYEEGTSNPTPQVAREGVRRAADVGATWAIVDTAGRTQIDDDLMSELEDVKEAVSPVETLLVVDAMTGAGRSERGEGVSRADRSDGPRAFPSWTATLEGGRRSRSYRSPACRSSLSRRVRASTRWRSFIRTGWRHASSAWATC